MEDVELGTKMNGTYINNIRYADATVLFVNTIQDLQELVDEVDDIGRRYGLNINVKKIKTTIISREQHLDAQVVINGKLVERVKEFKYLVTLITEDLNPEIEIKRRIGYAKATFGRMKNILTNKVHKLEKQKANAQMLRILSSPLQF